jgi:predicted nucleotidyltransferase
VREITEHDIRNFVKQVVNRFNPERIVLFGSHASESTSLDSDVDMLVVMDFEGRPQEQAFEIRRSIKRTFPLDLLVRRPADVEHRLTMGDFFLREILEKGKVLYERVSG